MGWASGGELMDKIIDVAMAHIKDTNQRFKFYMGAIQAFEQYDCDVLHECKGKDPIFDKALKKSGYENEE